MNMFHVYEHEKNVELLLNDNIIDTSINNNYAIKKAVEIVKLLLCNNNKKSNVAIGLSINNNYLLKITIFNKYTNIITLLLLHLNINLSQI